MNRREFLALSTITSAWILTGCGGGGTSSSGVDTTSENQNKLTIPPLMEGKLIDGTRHYDLLIQESTHKFLENFTTNTYGISGSYLGPTLKLINGEKVSLNYTNNLKEPTTIHGHGMHVPANMDGGAHQTIAVNTTWSAQYTVDQKACTNWYHPHYMGNTAEHVYKGLAGLLIVEDEEIQALDLPKTYGEDDIPLVLQDRFFDSNGQIDYSPTMREIMRGYEGDTFLANGVINATFDAPAKELRFRILNGSNSSVYTLEFSDGRAFKQIGTDNSLLEAPVALTSLGLSPAERAEIVVDLSADFGKSIELKERNNNITFLKIEVNKEAKTTTVTPNTLTSLTFLNASDAVNTRSFTLSASGPGNLKINGKSMDMMRIDERVPLNQIEIWEVKNSMNMNHNFHIHATHFTILERNGSASNVAENEKGYKDTVFLGPNDSVKLIVKMIDYVDSTSPYMYHCHFLEHEDAGMMGQFVVE